MSPPTRDYPLELGASCLLISWRPSRALAASCPSPAGTGHLVPEGGSTAAWGFLRGRDHEQRVSQVPAGDCQDAEALRSLARHWPPRIPPEVPACTGLGPLPAQRSSPRRGLCRQGPSAARTTRVPAAAALPQSEIQFPSLDGSALPFVQLSASAELSDAQALESYSDSCKKKRWHAIVSDHIDQIGELRISSIGRRNASCRHRPGLRREIAHPIWQMLRSGSVGDTMHHASSEPGCAHPGMPLVRNSPNRLDPSDTFNDPHPARGNSEPTDGKDTGSLSGKGSRGTQPEEGADRDNPGEPLPAPENGNRGRSPVTPRRNWTLPVCGMAEATTPIAESNRTCEACGMGQERPGP